MTFLHDVWMTVDFIVNRHDAIYGRHKTRSIVDCVLCGLQSNSGFLILKVALLELASNGYDNQLIFLQVLL